MRGLISGIGLFLFGFAVGVEALRYPLVTSWIGLVIGIYCVLVGFLVIEFIRE